MGQYKLQIMTINKQHESEVKFLCQYVEKNEKIQYYM